MQKEMRVILHKARQEDLVPVCGYGRVSTDKDEQAESYHLQENYWTRKLTTEPKYRFMGMFGDEGVSGDTQRKRRGFLEMVKLCRMGRIKIIFTKSVARFGRNTTETLKTIKELREMGVTVVFENDGLDTAQLTDELMLRLKAILAEEELKTMGSRVKWSARIRFSEGSVELARLYGYDITRTEDKKVVLTVNEEEAKIVRLIYELYLGGMGVIAIANHLQDINAPTKMGGAFGKSSVTEILRNEKYMGDALLQKTFRNENGIRRINEGEVIQHYVEYNHEPIIDPATFHTVQAERVSRREKIKFCKEPKITEFTGKIECGHCGKRFNRKLNSKIVNFDRAGWMCRTANNRGVTGCPANTINETLLKAMAVDAFNEYLATPLKNATTANYDAEIAKLVEEEKSLRKLFQDGRISYSTFTAKQKELKDKYKVLDGLKAQEQGFELYTKEGRTATEYTADIVETHIEKIVAKGYQIRFIFKNKQEIVKEWKYEHRRYCKAY